jgi:Lrp/AsnC family transcriptional regulator, regulator for asnA, asnC and gidA
MQALIGVRLTQCAAPVRTSRALRRSTAARLATAAATDGRRGPIRRPGGIDELDRRIIEALQRNGRDSFRAIAGRVGVSEATVRARYGRLCRDEILQVVAVTNPLGLGLDQALVGVRTTGAPEPVADEIASWEEADYVVVTAGQFDLIVEVVCADRRELLEVTNRMRALDSVVSTETFLYLQMFKQLYDWGAGAPEANGR